MILVQNSLTWIVDFEPVPLLNRDKINNKDIKSKKKNVHSELSILRNHLVQNHEIEKIG